MIRHIPDAATGRTYCGRPIASVRHLISIEHDCIEDAECKVCQRSDDRRTIENHRREQAATPPPVYPDQIVRPEACPQCDSGDVTKAYRCPPGLWKCQTCSHIWQTRVAS